MLRFFVFLAATALLFSACDKADHNTGSTGKLIFKLKLDPTQARLNSAGQPAPLPNGNGAQNPSFNSFSAHQIELVPTKFTPVNEGSIAYKGAETTADSTNAIDFSKATFTKDGEILVSVPISELAVGTYQYIRVSVSYQNYDVLFNVNNVPVGNGQTIDLIQQKGTVASFLGFNSYIETLQPKTLTKTVNANKKQGYWAFETDLAAPYSAYNQIITGEATRTTVFNPITTTTPTPPGSCLVTGTFDGAGLEITGKENNDITVNLSFSTKQSFEWVDLNSNGQLDIDLNANTSEIIVDMGLRGLEVSVR